jgi:hypothetical protein
MNDPSPAHLSRTSKLAHLPVSVAGNCSYKGARVLNTHYALELGATPLDAGLLLASYGLSPLIRAVYEGGLSDRYGGLGMRFGQSLDIVLACNYSPSGRAGEAIGMRIAINSSMRVVAPMPFGALGSFAGLAPLFRVTYAVLGAGAYAMRKRGG